MDIVNEYKPIKLKTSGNVFQKITTLKPATPDNIILLGLITFHLNLDFTTSLEIFAQEGKISRLNIEALKRWASEDYKAFTKIAEEQGRGKQLSDDYEAITAYFTSLADVSLSEYQKHLKNALSCIFMIDFTITALEYTIRNSKKKLSTKPTRMLTRKRNELWKWFANEYQAVSNTPFNMEKFRLKWHSITEMSTQELKNLFTNPI